MNPIDVFVVVTLVTLGLLGFYQGFLRSALSVAAFFLSCLLALLVANPIANLMYRSDHLTSAMLYYIEGAEFVHNTELARVDVSELTPEQLENVLENITTPFPLEPLVEQNLVSEVYVTEISRSVGSTITQTIVAFTINCIAFLIAFLIIRLILAFLINAYDSIFCLPVLRLRFVDSPSGACLGLLNGFFILFVVFMIVPMILIVLSQQGENAALYILANTLIEESRFGTFFFESNYILGMMKGAF